MIGQMVQNVPPLGSFPVSMALVPVQVAMADGVVLKGSIVGFAHDEEALLSGLLSLQFVLFDLALGLQLCLDLAHFQTETGCWCVQ